MPGVASCQLNKVGKDGNTIYMCDKKIDFQRNTIPSWSDWPIFISFTLFDDFPSTGPRTFPSPGPGTYYLFQTFFFLPKTAKIETSKNYFKNCSLFYSNVLFFKWYRPFLSMILSNVPPLYLAINTSKIYCIMTLSF